MGEGEHQALGHAHVPVSLGLPICQLSTAGAMWQAYDLATVMS